MLFNSYTFVFAFLPVVWLGFFLLGRLGQRGAVAWLVACSLFFYGWWDPRYLLLLGFSIAFNFSVGRALQARAGAGRGLLVLGVAANLGLLGYFKYANFLVDSWNGALGASVSLAPIVLPLAISFFTFQQIAYLVDTRRGETPRHDLLSYLLFVTFFPQLIAGPIVYHKEMLPQFARRETFRPRAAHVSVGITIFVIGLFKKVVLADGVSGWANTVFDGAGAGHVPGMIDAWLGTLAYTFQIYFDFSGYSDMAIGLGRVFGIRLPMNFNSPYKAESIVDFWRRWHMTLSRFLRRYLYFPLGGNRLGRPRRHVNLMVTMLLGGLWHGAGWNFAIWGGLHGAYLVVNHGWRATTGGRFALPAWPARALTFVAVVVAWVFFRAESFDAARIMLASMSGLAGTGVAPALPVFEATTAISGLLLIAWFAPNTQQILREHDPVILGDGEIDAPRGLAARLVWRPTPAGAAALAALGFAGVLYMQRVREFLYFQF